VTLGARKLANLDTSDALSELHDEPPSIVALDESADDAWDDEASDPALDFLVDLDREQLLAIIQVAIVRRAHGGTSIHRCLRLLRARAAGE
jgi:hypothetical protein